MEPFYFHSFNDYLISGVIWCLFANDLIN